MTHQRIDIDGILTSYDVIEAVYPATEDNGHGRYTTFYIRFKSGEENEISEEAYKKIRAEWAT